MIRILIADDQPLVRAGLRTVLEAEPDIEVIGEATNGTEALERSHDLHPDVVLMDVRMPVMDGLTATKQLLQAGSGVRVVMLTTFDPDEYVFEALRAGASGFMLKDATAEQLAMAVRVAAAGDAMLAPAVTRRLIEQFAQKQTVPADHSARLRELTDREREVLGLVGRGLSNAEIAQRLFLGETTVKTHVGHILSKLELRDRVQAVVLAHEAGLVSSERS